MKSILHEFYYGNINPNEKPFKRDSEYSRVIKILFDSEEELLKLLNGAEKTLFETFSKALGDLNAISVADSFVDGFCLGARIAIEVMDNKL
ncbi:MAG: DUF6809 family protein [Lacrimispora sphenoides]